MMTPEEYWAWYRKQHKPITTKTAAEYAAEMPPDQIREVLFEMLADADIDEDMFNKMIMRTYR